jgi:hypothetical protein
VIGIKGIVHLLSRSRKDLTPINTYYLGVRDFMLKNSYYLGGRCILHLQVPIVLKEMVSGEAKVPNHFITRSTHDLMKIKFSLASNTLLFRLIIKMLICEIVIHY